MQKQSNNQIQRRLARLEDSLLSLVQLNRVFSDEADSIRERLKRLESFVFGSQERKDSAHD
jgi:hypothetical protein